MTGTDRAEANTGWRPRFVAGKLDNASGVGGGAGDSGLKDEADKRKSARVSKQVHQEEATEGGRVGEHLYSPVRARSR